MDSKLETHQKACVGLRDFDRKNDASMRANPLLFLCSQQSAAHYMCDQLESIADSLPKSVNKLVCIEALAALKHNQRIHSIYESEFLFPLMRTRIGDQAGLYSQLKLLDDEHLDDEAYAEEIAEALRGLIAGCCAVAPETLAYMLRGYFEGLRRHIAFEKHLIVPLAIRHLRSDDLETLENAIVSNVYHLFSERLD